jgi:adenine-specific DNA-methyltransferase
VTQRDMDIQITPSGSTDFQTEFAQQLAEIAPEVLTDGKVDLEKVRELLASDITDDRERFGLFWPGKKRALRVAQEPTTATLSPDIENSKNWDSTGNVFIEGDNLEALKIIQKHYHGKIKMIYIDPPYNTGNDFVYPDDFKEGLENYLEWTKQVNEEGRKVSTNAETQGRFHSNWLNMMYPRLKLARNLLTHDGVFIASIGQDEVANLVKMIVEIFGENNFLGLVPRVAKTTSDSGDFFAPSVDYLVFAARNRDLLDGFTQPLSERDIKAYTRSDSKGRYKTVGFYQASLTLERSRNARYFIEAPDGSKVIPPENKRWRTILETYNEFLNKNEIEFIQVRNSPLLDENGKQSKWNIYTKQYLDRRLEEGRTPRDFIIDFPNVLGTNDAKELGIPFDFPKPVGLIKYLMTIVGVKDQDICLDFFAGSGTTAQACLELNANDGGNRRFILVQLPEPTLEGSDAHNSGFARISEITRKRIDLAGNRVADSIQGSNVDTGFRMYKLTNSNFSKWQTTNQTPTNELEQHLLDLKESTYDHASPDAILSEVLLKQGYSLTEDIHTITIETLELRSVGEGTVLAYLDETRAPSLEQIRKLLDLKPVKFIILEDAFNGNDELKTNIKQECNSRNIELWTA